MNNRSTKINVSVPFIFSEVNQYIASSFENLGSLGELVVEAVEVIFLLLAGLSAIQLCKNKAIKNINRYLYTFFINLLIVSSNFAVKIFKL